SCTCSGSNHPTGCRCPSETTQLTGIPINQCECRSSADPRAGSACPAYCVNGQVNSSCVCDSNNASFPYTTCYRDKACTINLINQSNLTCPCLRTGDPRAGLGQCPAYCIKGYTNTTCACDSGSTYYPVTQCNIDKLCITDLIHQSITNCPCMTKNDPRSESVCKPSDPDPTNPIIPDPSEKDPETEQEQGSGSKQDGEKTFNMIWIIFIVIGILAIAAIVTVKKYLHLKDMIILKRSNKNPSLHIKISETPHQSFASERSFRTASESHRGSLNESRNVSLSSDFSDSADSGSRRDADQEDEEEFVPTEFQLKMYMKYQKFLNPIEEGRSSLESINTGGIKEDESPKSENSNSSDELKNKDNQIKDIKSSE
ncbi:MAG: hypothetical protein EZS28_013925, partial [Streblomastix strix]